MNQLSNKLTIITTNEEPSAIATAYALGEEVTPMIVCRKYADWKGDFLVMIILY
jgi:hypothetical protein